MKKLITLLVMCFVVVVAMPSQAIIGNPQDMFPTLEAIQPLEHFSGDTVTRTVTLYAMRNANHYFDAYFALLNYHNIVAKDATLLSEVNATLTNNAKSFEMKLVASSTKWFFIGAVSSAIAIVGVLLFSK